MLRMASMEEEWRNPYLRRSLRGPGQHCGWWCRLGLSGGEGFEAAEKQAEAAAKPKMQPTESRLGK